MTIFLQEGRDNSTTLSTKFKNNRKEISGQVINFEEAAKLMNERMAAKSIGVARTTLRDQRSRKNKIELPIQIVDFFESPLGIEFLNRMITAIILVMVEMGGCGIRLVCLFLELTQLDFFVASSYGSVQKIVKKTEANIVEFGIEERPWSQLRPLTVQ